LAEEITTPGPGQLHALFVDGGNPATCIPDQQRIVAALRELELLVCIEPFMTNTARLAHYIIPPKLMFERFDLASRDYETIVNTLPYTQYAVPVAAPPNESEVVDDWFVFWALAQRLGVDLNFDGVPLNMDHAPSTEELLAILARHSSVPFDEIRAATAGRLFPVEPMIVLPGDPQSSARFDVMPDDVRTELTAVLTEDSICAEFPLRLSVRRMREVQNTMYRQLPAIHRQAPFNPLWVHPNDLAALGLRSGDNVELCSKHGRIIAQVEADASMRCGVVSMAHGWGGLPGDDATFNEVGVNTNRLTDTANVESINAMPRMSGIPVRLQLFTQQATVSVARQPCPHY
jgi:anaerobic selenocysteine-containing dehydrogenase